MKAKTTGPSLQPVTIEQVAVRSSTALVSRGLRTDSVRILTCEVPETGHTSVIVCAPVDYYLAGLQIYPEFFARLNDYTEANLVHNGPFHDAFSRAMRNAGLGRDEVPTPFFAPYTLWSSYGSGRGRFGKRFPVMDFDRRVLSCFIPTAVVTETVAYWTELHNQVSPQDVASAPEALNEVTSAFGFSEIPDNSKVRYESPDFSALCSNHFKSVEQELLAMDRLSEIASRLDQGACDINLFPLHKVKFPPSVYIGRACTDEGWTRARLRSRVIRKLGWVWHFSAVSDYAGHIRAHLDTFEAAKRAVVTEILENLDAYLADIRSSYTKVVEAPTIVPPKHV